MSQAVLPPCHRIPPTDDRILPVSCILITAQDHRVNTLRAVPPAAYDTRASARSHLLSEVSRVLKINGIGAPGISRRHTSIRGRHVHTAHVAIGQLNVQTPVGFVVEELINSHERRTRRRYRLSPDGHLFASHKSFPFRLRFR